LILGFFGVRGSGGFETLEERRITAGSLDGVSNGWLEDSGGFNHPKVLIVHGRMAELVERRFLVLCKSGLEGS
jgi:hypothetical protein